MASDACIRAMHTGIAHLVGMPLWAWACWSTKLIGGCGVLFCTLLWTTFEDLPTEKGECGGPHILPLISVQRRSCEHHRTAHLTSSDNPERSGRFFDTEKEGGAAAGGGARAPTRALAHVVRRRAPPSYTSVVDAGVRM